MRYPQFLSLLWPRPTLILEVGLDFEELNTVANTWTWSRDPETQAQFIRQCFQKGLQVEWWQTAEGWELRIRRPMHGTYGI